MKTVVSLSGHDYNECLWNDSFISKSTLYYESMQDERKILKFSRGAKSYRFKRHGTYRCGNRHSCGEYKPYTNEWNRKVLKVIQTNTVCFDV